MSDGIDGNIKGCDSLLFCSKQLFKGQFAGMAEHPTTADSEVSLAQCIRGVKQQWLQETQGTDKLMLIFTVDIVCLHIFFNYYSCICH